MTQQDRIIMNRLKEELRLMTDDRDFWRTEALFSSKIALRLSERLIIDDNNKGKDGN